MSIHPCDPDAFYDADPLWLTVGEEGAGEPQPGRRLDDVEVVTPRNSQFVTQERTWRTGVHGRICGLWGVCRIGRSGRLFVGRAADDQQDT